MRSSLLQKAVMTPVRRKSGDDRNYLGCKAWLIAAKNARKIQ